MVSFFLNLHGDRIPLRAPPTSCFHDRKGAEYSREGFIIQLYLEDGTIGLGEVVFMHLFQNNFVSQSKIVIVLVVRLEFVSEITNDMHSE